MPLSVRLCMIQAEKRVCVARVALEDKEGAEWNMNVASFAWAPEGELAVGGIG